MDLSTTEGQNGQRHTGQGNTGSLNGQEPPFKTLLMQAPVGIALLDGPEHVYSFANPLYLTLFGLSEEKLIGRTLRQVWPEAEGQGIYELFDSTFQSGNPFADDQFAVSFQQNGQTKTGYYNLFIQPIKDQAGSVTSLLIHVHEVGRQVDKKIEESESQLRNIINQSPDPILVLKGEALVLDIANQPLFELWQVGKDAVGTPFLEILPEMKEQGFYELLIDVLRNDVTHYGYETPVYFDRANQVRETVYFNFIYQPFKETDGSISGVLVTATDVTQSVRAKQELEETKLRYHNLIFSSPSAIGILMGPELVITTGNEAILHIWGKGESVFGKPYFEALPELAEQGYRQVFDQVYTTGNAANFVETPVRILQDGIMTLKYYNFILYPQRNINGQVEGIGIIATEVTLQAEQNRKVKESEARFRTLIEQAPVATCLFVGRELQIEIANGRIIDIMGKGPSVLGKPLAQAVPELKGQPFLQQLDNVFTSGQAFENRNARADLIINGQPKTFYFDYIFKPLKNADDEIYAILDMTIDVTDHVLARLELESETRFRNLADDAPLFIFMADHNLTVSYVNKSFLQYLDLQHHTEFAGRIWEQYVHPDDIARMNHAYEDAWQTQSPYQLEIRLRQADTGHYNWFVSTSVPRYEGETFKGFLGTWINIQAQKELTVELEQKVAERTEALYVANRELQRSNQELEQFAHVASHDLKEPVRKVKVFSNLLEAELKDTLTEKGKQYLAKIHSATDRIYTMIEGVLSYSRLNASLQPLQTVDLNQVMASIETDLEVTIKNSGASVSYRNLPAVEGAPVLLYQLFYNLINNSIKFAKAGLTPQVQLEAETFTQDGQSFIRIMLRDNGIGFEQDQSKMIFDSFIRLNSKDIYEGTGLGLALCKKIVDRHGGTIQASGQPNIGATFVIELPARQTRSSI